MAKNVAKRSKQASFKPAAGEIPTPFEKAPQNLQPLLDQLDPSKVYITHVDRHLTEYKKQIFLMPVLINSLVAVLLAWRVYAAAPTYLAMVQAVLGYASSAAIDTTNTTRSDQVWVILRRTGMMLLDFLLFRFIGVWPLTFFLEQPANPVTWRWRIGFQAQEVIVRVSRNWSNEDLMRGVKQGEENPFFKTRVLPSIAREHMKKTGYLMMDGSWDLDFPVMQDAHYLLDTKKLVPEDLDKLVLTFQDANGWLAWRWETGSDVIEERRKKIVLLKEVLTKMGKESLFWKWMEIVEDERDTDGGFTAARQKRVAERVQKEFEKNGVDFEEIMMAIGGLEEMPLQESGQKEIERLGI